jgi:tripartite ATP-independent transporter DctP family solute receptor
MKKVKSITTSLFILLIVFCILGPLQKEANAITLRYAHVGTAGEIQTRFGLEFATLVKERTEGRIEIQVFPNSQLGNIDEMMDGIKSGTISMGHHAFPTLGRFIPDMAVFSAPFIFRDAKHALNAGNPSTSPILREMNQELIKKANMRVIGSYYMGARQLSAKLAVYSPKDLKGKKIRVVPNKLWTSMVKGMGAIPTPVEVSELSTALMTGLVSGQENPLDTIWARKWYEAQSHIMMTNHMLLTLCVFMNEKVWQSIPEKDQAIISDCLVKMADKTVEWNRTIDEDLKQKMKEKGVTFIEEKDGLDVGAFRTAVLAQIKEDFPEWAKYIDKLKELK